MLINYCEKMSDVEIHVITCANVVKGWYNAKWATTVLDKVLELTGTELIKSHYTYFTDDQRRQELNETEKLITKIHQTTVAILGTTQNPPLDVEHLREGRFEARDEGHGRHRNPSKYYVGNPMNIDKRFIA